MALIVLAVAQLMVVLDSSIVNIALPSAQRELGISDADRQWIITAYTLTFGGLLLLGGRLADFAGRKRVFVVGLLGFACASALGGLAPNATVLFVARGLQGACGALLAPACLSLIAVTFTHSRERAHAFAVYAGVSGGGAALGLILGGALTQYGSWRWCLLINVPLALLVAVLALFMVSESRVAGQARYDFPGAITATLALVILVYGFDRSEVEGWFSATAIGCLVGAGLLFLLFVFIELRTSEPLLPMRLLWERNRGGAYLVSLLAGVGLLGTLLLMSYYLQEVLHYSALQSGLAFLPFSAGTIVSSALGSRLLHRFGPRFLMTLGLVAGAVGMFWLAQIGVDSSFVGHVLPAEVVLSLGMGLGFVPLTSTALVGVVHSETGIASALVNTSQQIGGSLGTALLNGVATSTALHYAGGRAGLSHVDSEAAVYGYSAAFLVGAVVLLCAAVTSLVLITARPGDLPAASGDRAWH